MSAVIIRKKDVERLGKEVLKEIKDFLNDEYLLSNFEKVKKDQEILQKILDNKGDNIDTEGIFYTLNSLKLDMEMDLDLYFKIKAFVNIFKVINIDYTYLED